MSIDESTADGPSAGIPVAEAEAENPSDGAGAPEQGCFVQKVTLVRRSIKREVEQMHIAPNVSAAAGPPVAAEASAATAAAAMAVEAEVAGTTSAGDSAGVGRGQSASGAASSTMSFLDLAAIGFYAALGVEPDATAAELKKGFSRQARIHHPDKGGDPACFRYIKTVFEILNDPDKRAEYDEKGREPFMPAPDPEDVAVPMPPVNVDFLRKLSESQGYALYSSMHLNVPVEV